MTGEEERDELVRQARELLTRLRADMRERFDRDLPLEELLFDRWERARSLGFGAGSSIYHNSYVYGDVSAGENVWIGPFTLLDGTGGLTIGDHVQVSPGVRIFTHDTIERTLLGGRGEPVRAPVSIGSCCYLGSQTVVAKGVSIGDHSVIGACSFVNRDVPPYTVAFGSPCRPVGRVVIDDESGVRLELTRRASEQQE